MEFTLKDFIENFCIENENIHDYFNIRINSRKLISFDGYYTIIDNNSVVDTIKFRVTIDRHNNYKVQMLGVSDYKKFYLWQKYYVRQDLESIFEYWVYNNKDNLAQFFKSKR